MNTAILATPFPAAAVPVPLYFLKVHGTRISSTFMIRVFRILKVLQLNLSESKSNRSKYKLNGSIWTLSACKLYLNRGKFTRI